MSLSITSQQKLDLTQLRAQKAEREKRKYRCYEDVLTKVHRRIELAARADQEYLAFRVPRFQLGMTTSYNQKSCICYIIYNLEKNGCHVDFVHPDVLLVAWDEPAQRVARPPPPALMAAQPTAAPLVPQIAAEPPVRPKSKTDNLMDINRTLFRSTKDAKPVYDSDAMESLKVFAQRVKRR